jgi:predicted nicotinamide N-methyase
VEAVALARFIQANLPLAPVPSLPEIHLHKAGPASGLWRLAEADADGFRSPYWAHYWAGGLALARHLLDQPTSVAGRRVLDLGAGSGMVAIAAALAGAAEVTAVDVDPYAITATGLNAAANGVTITALLEDVTAGPALPVDVVLVGDLFYEPGLADRVGAFLDRCLTAGREVLVGDPGRAFLPRTRLHPLADYRVIEAGPAKPSTVFAYRHGLG